MHLGEPEPSADLGLGEIVVEAQLQDLTLAFGEGAEKPVDEHGVLDVLVAGLSGVREKLDRFAAVLSEGPVLGIREVGGARREGLKDVLDAVAGAIGQLEDPLTALRHRVEASLGSDPALATEAEASIRPKPGRRAGGLRGTRRQAESDE